MYGKCGALEKAQEVFDEMPDRNVVSWSALIAGFSQNGHGMRAMDLFGRMPNEGVVPNTVTFVNVLTACAATDDGFPKGKRAHIEIESRGLLFEGNIELCNALIDMYAKSGEMRRAQKVFDEACGRDVVSWNALISGFSQHGKGEEALQYFQKMKDAHISPDVITFVCVLKACGSIGALERGKQVHDEIISKGLLGEEAILSTALVDMYIKCGALGKAREVFDETPIRNVVSWNALISGYSQRGQCEEALACFRKMQTEGIFPDQVTFLSVLVACCHSGRVEEGEMYFQDMNEKCCLTPGIEHETCMVELYSEAGLFDKALKVVAEMASCDYAMWCALLRACDKWGNVKVGRFAFEEAIQLDKSNSSAYACMSNIYACAGMQIDVEQIEAMRIQNTLDQN
jgi:pentatricopeptide repeat protein